MGHYISPFKYGDRVIVKDGFKKGFYSRRAGVIVGFIDKGENQKYKVEFHAVGTEHRVVKIIDPINLTGAN